MVDGSPKKPRSLLPTGTLILLAVFAAFLFLTASRPPKWAYAAYDSIQTDQCSGGFMFGIRKGMTRDQVLHAIGRMDGDFPVDWYIADQELALPPDGVFYPVWPPGKLPVRFADAEQWVLHRAGFAAGFDLTINFSESNTVTCAELDIDEFRF